MAQINRRSEKILLIFLKYPQPGHVKSRLAKDIGKIRAAFLYKNIAERIIRKTESGFCQQIIVYSPVSEEKRIRKWLTGNKDFYPQKGRDLGSRMFNAFKMAFCIGAKKAVVIGTDSPFIDRKIVRKAFKELDKNKCVLGPSLDGGYYLMGLSCLYRGLFERIEWGGKNVFSETVGILNRLKASYSLLEPGLDIDELEDLVFFAGKIKQDEDIKDMRLGPVFKAFDKRFKKGLFPPIKD